MLSEVRDCYSYSWKYIINKHPILLGFNNLPTTVSDNNIDHGEIIIYAEETIKLVVIMCTVLLPGTNISISRTRGITEENRIILCYKAKQSLYEHNYF